MPLSIVPPVENGKGQVFFGIFVTCPSCNEDIDLFKDDEAPGLNEEGYITQILTKWFSNVPGAEKTDIDVLCGYCKHEFKVTELIY